MRSIRSSIGVRWYFLPGQVMSTIHRSFQRKTIIKSRQICRFESSFCVFRRSGLSSISYVHRSLLATTDGQPPFDKNKTRGYGFLSTYFYRWWGSLFYENKFKYINWDRSLCRRGGLRPSSISWPCFILRYYCAFPFDFYRSWNAI